VREGRVLTVVAPLLGRCGALLRARVANRGRQRGYLGRCLASDGENGDRKFAFTHVQKTRGASVQVSSCGPRSRT
jgi:hypothetical protein